jgi:hypothetical protein
MQLERLRTHYDNGTAVLGDHKAVLGEDHNALVYSRLALGALCPKNSAR